MSLEHDAEAEESAPEEPLAETAGDTDTETESVEPTEEVEYSGLSRRGMLLSGGLLGLLGLGVGSASADASGQIGTATDPLNKLHANELNGGITGDTALTSLTGNGLSISGGSLAADLGDGLTINSDAIEADVDGGFEFDSGTIGLKAGDGLRTTGGGILSANLGDGITTSSNELTAALGDGLEFASNGKIDAKLGTGLEFDSQEIALTNSYASTGLRSFAAGASSNNGDDADTFVGGGNTNTAGAGDGTGTNAFVGGGNDNTASGSNSAIPGGSGNTADDDDTVCLGRNNTASGQFAIAIGNKANATHRGSIVFGDGNDTQDLGTTSSENIQEFRVQARNGIYFQSSNKKAGNVRKEPDIYFKTGLPAGSGNNVQITTDTNKLVDADKSSARYKTNIEPIGTDTSGVLDLQPTAYEYEETGQADTGLIAEEVDEALPEIVSYDEEGRPNSVRYDRVGMFLAPEVSENRDRLAAVEAAREECEETIETLEVELDAKNARVADQADRIDQLESAVENKSVLLESVRSVVDEKKARIDELEAENAKLETRLSAVEAELGVGGVTADASVADD